MRFLPALLVLCFFAPSSAQSLPDPLVIAQTAGGIPHPQHAWLLAYSQEVDKRPLYVDNALVAAQLSADRWALLKAHRHPKDDNTWKLSIVYDAPVTPHREYDHRPTAKEVDKFLQDAWWHFKPKYDFRILFSALPQDNWQQALGFTPKYKFAK